LPGFRPECYNAVWWWPSLIFLAVEWGKN
jgi:hypothetical protein